jgi:hypothetical protein
MKTGQDEQDEQDGGAKRETQQGRFSASRILSILFILSKNL